MISRDMNDFYKEEIEYLTGKLYNGDMTPLIFDLLKESCDPKGLLKYLTGEEIKEKQVEAVTTPTAAPSFEQWFKSCKRIE